MTKMPTVIETPLEVAEEICGVVVCLRLREDTADLFKLYTDNAISTCGECGHAIFHRPAVPQKPPKICNECFEKTQEGETIQDVMILTNEGRAEFIDLIEKIMSGKKTPDN